MFECQICGLLSLGGTACPACGSQLRTDLSATELSDEVLPTEVPGLDDAAAAWYELEGIEPPAEEEEEAAPTPSSTNLPFGFQGESNVYDSRLPFGIGSFADGIPFDSDKNAEATIPLPVAEERPPESVSAPTETSQTSPAPAIAPPVAATESLSLSEESKHEPAPEASSPVAQAPQGHVEVHEAPVAAGVDMVAPAVAPPTPAAPPAPPTPFPPPTPPAPPAIPPTPPTPPAAPAIPEAPALVAEPVRLTSARLVTTAPVQDEPAVPDYWKIDAQIPDYEQIYEQSDAVVEMEYASLEDDVVVYDHTVDSPAAVFHSPLEATPASNPKPSIKLQLHPVQALRVDVGASAPMQTALQDGFAALQKADWSSAARSFQAMAATMPSNAEVYNNYGIALLQRATAMRAQGDTQAVAETQFESSILALREAAKNAPTNGDILVNLAIALIESGRPEKALGIMNVHNARTPGSAKGLNTAAAAMFELGQLTQAVETLGKAGDDAVIRGNLLQLSPKAAHS